jgi:hypothetical protein
MISLITEPHQCNPISVFDPERVGQRCDFCGSSALVPYDEIKEAFRPESLLPMKLSDSQVRDSIRQCYRTRWFAPNRLKTRALTDTVHGVYVPYWTFRLFSVNKTGTRRLLHAFELCN